MQAAPDNPEHSRPSTEEPEDDPRMREQGSMPMETIDSTHNMPGRQDQPPPASAVGTDDD